MSSGQAAKRLNQEPTVFSEKSHTTKYKMAPNGKRIAAFLIDGLIAYAITKGLLYLLTSVLHYRNVGFVLVVSMLFSFAYWVVQAIEFEGTPGKKMMGLRIVTAAESRRLSYGQMVLREIIGRPISMIPLFAGYFWGLFSKDHRAWHDKIGKTRVVEYP